METNHSRRADGLADIPKWTRRYAQTRALPAIWFMSVFLIISIALGTLSHFAGTTYRAGHYTLATILAAGAVVVAMIIVVGAIVLSVPKWGGLWLDRMAREKLYGAEGHVAFARPARRRKVVGLIGGGIYGLCILASVALGFAGYIPHDSMQPVSALYVVPFLVFLYILLRPQMHPLMLLWPLLYGVHAILLVAGAPILFTGKWDGFNMYLPIAGYGLLSGLITHLYNRYALRRLKKAAGNPQALNL